MSDRETRGHSKITLASPAFAELEGAHPELTPAQREALRADAAAVQLARSLRRKVFEENIFGEPAWEILLALYVNDLHRRLNTSRLTELSGVAMTTVLRWLDVLEDAQLILRRENSRDQRIVVIELSRRGRSMMDEYFMRLRQLPSRGAANHG